MRQMAIMKGVGFGCRDVSSPVLWFSAYVSECLASLQVLGAKEACAVLEKHLIYDVKQLEGKPCWVDFDEDTRTMKFLDLFVP